ncbi:site-specific DNA-methyltransferase [Halobaculum sp. MBLA0143]|uniref:DNA-methyltransferase n=1 Tax=Halobaculum sp. MBLA0143 TaxID=3079933 RepID=UPI00352340A1
MGPDPASRETAHRVCLGDARQLPLPDDSVELVVTSPPYPMIEQWDDQFAAMDDGVAAALSNGDGQTAFDRMHAVLREAWAELARVVVDGGVVCVNVGDATRTVAGEFRLYPNHARITEQLTNLGFRQLPGVLWRKPTNAPTKFMGSGTLPPNAYVTLEHEHVLVFRNGSRRSFEARADRRYEASYFHEERNRWFSDLWDLSGDSQGTADDTPRDRRAAFPTELPYRLISMYSVYGDTVLDPFWGTGTTTFAAMAAARDSVGVESVPGLPAQFDDRVDSVRSWSQERAQRRLAAHREAVADQEDTYEATNYDFEVVSNQERRVQLYAVTATERRSGGYYAHHDPVTDDGESTDAVTGDGE